MYLVNKKEKVLFEKFIFGVDKVYDENCVGVKLNVVVVGKFVVWIVE